MSEQIKSGKLGSTSLVRDVEKILHPNEVTDDFQYMKVRGTDGRHLITIKKNIDVETSLSDEKVSRIKSINFPKDIRENLTSSNIARIQKTVINCLEEIFYEKKMKNKTEKP